MGKISVNGGVHLKNSNQLLENLILVINLKRYEGHPINKENFLII